MAEALIRMDDGRDRRGRLHRVGEQTGQLAARPDHAEPLDGTSRLDPTHGSKLPIAVNLSVDQLEDRATTDWLLTWDPPGGLHRIVIEVTETVDLADTAGQSSR